MCTSNDASASSKNDALNALHQCDDEDAPVITLEYGPYMN